MNEFFVGRWSRGTDGCYEDRGRRDFKGNEGNFNRKVLRTKICWIGEWSCQRNCCGFGGWDEVGLHERRRRNWGLIYRSTCIYSGGKCYGLRSSWNSLSSAEMKLPLLDVRIVLDIRKIFLVYSAKLEEISIEDYRRGYRTGAKISLVGWMTVSNSLCTSVVFLGSSGSPSHHVVSHTWHSSSLCGSLLSRGPLSGSFCSPYLPLIRSMLDFMQQVDNLWRGRTLSEDFKRCVL